MPFNPADFGATAATPSAPPSSSGFNPTDFGATPVADPRDSLAEHYKAQQNQPKTEGFMSKVGHGIMQGLGQAGQAGLGALKSIPATLNNASLLGQRGLQTITSKLPGMPQGQTASLPDSVTTPSNQDQAAGFLGGQLAQGFAAPNEAIDAGAGKVAELANAGKAQPLITGAAKVVAQAGAGATEAKLGGASDQGALTTGAISGGLSAAGSVFSQALQNSAQKSMSKVLGATTKDNKAISDKVVPDLVGNHVMALTRNSFYNKAADNVEKADEALTNAYNAIPKDVQSNWTPVLNTLQEEKNALKVNGVVLDNGKYNALHNIQTDLLRVAGGDAGTAVNPTVPIEDARSARQILDKAIREKTKTFGITGSESDTLNANKVAANAIRKQLAVEHPEIAVLNKQFSFWKNVQDVLGSTIQRTKSQSSLTGEMAQDTGAVIGAMNGGGLSKIILDAATGKLLKNAVQSTAWRTVSAAGKSQLANFLVSGDVAKAAVLLQKLTNPTKAK